MDIVSLSIWMSFKFGVTLMHAFFFLFLSYKPCSCWLTSETLFFFSLGGNVQGLQLLVTILVSKVLEEMVSFCNLVPLIK